MPNFYDEHHGKGGLYHMAADGTRTPINALPTGEEQPAAEPEPAKPVAAKPSTTASKSDA